MLLHLCLFLHSSLVGALPSWIETSSIQTFAVADEPEEEPGSSGFWFKIGLSAVLVLLAGFFAGLTIGLMGLDPLHLQVLASSSDDPVQKANAKKVLTLLRKGKHWVLVVLLLGNVIVNESLPIFLDSAIGGGIAAILISTAMIFIFGEIIPQAVCARYGLAIGAKFSKLVLFLMYLFSPIAWPIAKLLDYFLGVEGPTTYKKAELRSFLQFHRNPNGQFGTYHKPNGADAALPLSDEEISILNGVLSLNEKKVTEIMTPMEDVVTLSAEQLLDHDLVDHILTSGYSRFPVHETGKPFSFIGFLLVKRLLLYDPSHPKRVSNFRLTVLPEAKPSISCFQALDYFQTGRSHLLLISSSPGMAGGALGVVTLEDIIEEIISEEIVDETDVYEDMQTKRRAKRQGTAAVMKGIVERGERTRRRESSNSILLVTPASTATFSGGVSGGGSEQQAVLASSLPTSPKLGSTAMKGGVGETTRLLSPIEESTARGRNGHSEGSGSTSEMSGGERTPIVEEPEQERGRGGRSNGYGATDAK